MNQTKQAYEEPIVEICRFASEDLIVTSDIDVDLPFIPED